MTRLTGLFLAVSLVASCSKGKKEEGEKEATKVTEPVAATEEPKEEVEEPEEEEASDMKTVNVSEGIDIAYTESGNAEGTPVVLLHGIFDSHHAYDLVLEHMGDDYHIFAPDFRGHGDSSKPEAGPYTVGDHAKDVVAFMDKVGLEKANIVAFSFGSHVGKLVAIEHPEKVEKLVLISTAPTVKGMPGMAEAGGMFASLKDPLDEEFLQGFVAGTLVGEVPPSYIEQGVADAKKIPAALWKPLFDGLANEDHSKKIGSIKAPTLIVWGEKDHLTNRKHQDALKKAVKGSKLVTYPDSGHSVPADVPEKLAKEIAGFLSAE